MKTLKYKFYMHLSKHTKDARLSRHYQHKAKRALYRHR